MSGTYVMMTLGAFDFQLSTAVYQELVRTNKYLWPSQDRFGSAPAVQFTGKGDETISLPGVIYPEWIGAGDAIDNLRTIAGKGQPLTMIGGTGSVFGQWVVEGIEEKQSIFAQAGVPRKIEFTLSLKKFSDDMGQSAVLSSITDGVAAAIPGANTVSALPAVPSTLSALSSATAMVKTVTDTANAALHAAGTITGKIGSALSSVAHIASALGIHSTTITNALNKSLGVVNGIRTSASGGLAILGRVQTVPSAISSAKGMFNDVSSMVQPATASSTSIKSSLTALQSEGAAPETISVVTDAMVSANQTTALASSLRDNTNTFINQTGTA